jgi:hypothetical protein
MLTHSTALKQAAAQALIDLMEVGSGTALIRIYTSAAVLLAEFELAASPMTLVGNTAELSTLPATATAEASGVADNFAMLNEAGSTVITGSVGTADEDLIVADTSITDGESCSITAFSWALG